jgi:hypothetical protein
MAGTDPSHAGKWQKVSNRCADFATSTGCGPDALPENGIGPKRHWPKTALAQNNAMRRALVNP